jgi:methanogenic corrinoid protein MtbC1
MSEEDRLKSIKEAVFDGELTEAKAFMKQVLDEKLDPARILSEGIIPAIREMGESMEEGDFFMPEVKMSTKVLQEVAEILRPHIVSEENMASYSVPLWTGEGDIDDIGKYLQTKMEQSADLPPQEQMRIMDMVVAGLNTHEFTPCKIQAKEVTDL